MIGGVDIILSTLTSPQNAISMSLGLIGRIWPDAVVEDADSGEKSAIGDGALIPETMTDIFVYQNKEIAQKWDQLGAEPELAGTMIHVLARKDEVTVVVDDPKSEAARIFISTMKNALHMDIFATVATLQGAAA